MQIIDIFRKFHIENIIRDEEKIASINVKNIKFNILEFKNLEKMKKEKIIWEYSVSKEVSRESEFLIDLVLDSYGILTALVKEIMDECKIKKGLDLIQSFPILTIKKTI